MYISAHRFSPSSYRSVKMPFAPPADVDAFPMAPPASPMAPPASPMAPPAVDIGEFDIDEAVFDVLLKEGPCHNY